MNCSIRNHSVAFVYWGIASSFFLLALWSTACFGQGLSTLPEPGQPGYQPLQNLIGESDSIKAQIRYTFGLSIEGIHLRDGSFNIMNDDIRDDPDLLPKDKAALSDQNKDLSGDDSGDPSPPDQPPGDDDNDDDGTDPPLPGSPPAGNNGDNGNNGPAPPTPGDGGGTIVSDTPDPGSGLSFIAPPETLKSLLGGYADPDFDFPNDIPDEISAELYRHYDTVRHFLGDADAHMWHGAGLTHSINEINRIRRAIDRHQFQKQLEKWQEAARIEFEKQEAEYARYLKSEEVLAAIRAGDETAGGPDDWIDIIQRSNYDNDWKVRIIDSIDESSASLREAIRKSVIKQQKKIKSDLRKRKIADLEDIPYDEVPLENFSARIFLYNNNNTHVAWIMEDPKSSTGWRIYEVWTDDNVFNSQLISSFKEYTESSCRLHAKDGNLIPLQSTPEKHRRMLSICEKRNDMITNTPDLFRYSILSAGGLTQNCASEDRGVAVESGHNLPEGFADTIITKSNTYYFDESVGSTDLEDRDTYNKFAILGHTFGGDSPARLANAVKLYSKGWVSINATGKQRFFTTWIPFRDVVTHFYWPWGEGTDLELETGQTVFGPQDFEAKIPKISALAPPPASEKYEEYYDESQKTDRYYDAVELVTEKRFSNGWQINTSYTYSRLSALANSDQDELRKDAPSIEEIGIPFPEEWETWLDLAKDRMETGVYVEQEIQDLVHERDERQRKTTFQSGNDSKENCPLDPPGTHFYVNDDWKLNDKRSFNLGLRMDDDGLKNSYDIQDDGPIIITDDKEQMFDSEFTVKKTADDAFSLKVVPSGEGNAIKYTLSATPDDQFAVGRGAWGQAGRDQWALEKIGLTPQVHSQMLSKFKATADPVIVAVIDSGIDFRHPELWGQLWRNRREIPFNGRDDDRNGYIDDVYGFNTQSGSSNIVDDNGHGTHVAGIIAARWDNRGIAGIAPQCQIMTIKAFDEQGKSDAARVALGIRYAVLNKAKIIHISAESSGTTDLDQAMIDWARSKGVLVVAASGSRGRDTTNVAPASLKGVLTVGACDRNDKRSKFSGWGQHVDLVAPGIDILSLRAQGTDFMHTMAGKALGIQENERVVNQRWYRAEGTSFAAPLVTGIAAALWAAHPDLTAEQIEKKLIMSCDDIETPGWDILTGAGRLNAAKALKTDPDLYLGTKILKIISRNQNGKRTLVVPGEATGSQFQRRWLQLAYGANPSDSDWQTISVSETPVNNGTLGEIPGTLLNRRGTWTIRSTVQDSRGAVRQAQVTIRIK